MAQYHVPPLEVLVEKFESLPGIGHKSAQRLAYHVLGMTQEEAQSFAQAILDAHEKIHTCKVCCNLTDDELCPVCRSGSRDKSTICVVEEPKDVFALERAGEYNGLYHVLHGAISPLSGIGPDQLRIKALLARMDAPAGYGRPPRTVNKKKKEGTPGGGSFLFCCLGPPDYANWIFRQLVYWVGSCSGSCTVSTPKLWTNSTGPAPSSSTEATFSLGDRDLSTATPLSGAFIRKA